MKSAKRLALIYYRGSSDVKQFRYVVIKWLRGNTTITGLKLAHDMAVLLADRGFICVELLTPDAAVWELPSCEVQITYEKQKG
jgi:hypothetical protein